MTQAAPAATQIVSLSATQLVERLAAGELSPVEVVEAHIARIEEVNPRLNAVVVSLFDEARLAAHAIQRSGREARQAGRRLPPLWGLPVTIKESFDVAGTDTTLGIETRVGQPAPDDGPLVARLRAAGAILLGKSNIHQGMLMFEAENPVFGRTLHPERDDRSPGGSSGGAASVVSAHGSPLSLASDIGGSIRQPAHSCGVCGLKPTSGRLTAVGSQMVLPGMQAIALQAGPIARRVADIDLAMRALMDRSVVERQADETLDPWPDYQSVSIEGLRIAVWTEDGHFRPSPAIRRAVDEAAEMLRGRGARVEAAAPPQIGEMMRVYLGLITADGLRSLARMLRGSRVECQVRWQNRLAGLRQPWRGALALFGDLIGQRRLASLVRHSGRRSAGEYWRLTSEAEQFRAELARWMREHQFDAMLLPPYGLPALKHRTALDLWPAAGYVFLANLLGWPAGVVPTTTVGAAGEAETERTDNWEVVERVARRVETGSTGLPVGVQVVGLPWREDVVLSVMAALESASGFADKKAASET